jgi:membrane protein required for colicin V production
VLASITTPDAIVLALVGFFALRGAIKGFVWQALRLGGLLLGFVLATQIGGSVGQFLAERFSFVPAAASDVVGWGVVVVGTFLSVTLIAHLARNAVRQANLTTLDRVLGFAAGAVLGLGIAAVGFTLWASTKNDADKRELLDATTSIEYMAKFIDTVTPFFPKDIRDRWGGVLHSLEK